MCVLVARARRRRRAVPLRSARCELGFVHRAEQAELLREASELVLTAGRAGSPLLGPAPTGARLAGFHRRLAEELELARADRVEIPLELVLLARGPAGRPLEARPLSACGRALGPCLAAPSLARAALALHPRPATRLTLARAWLAEGWRERARAELDELARSTPTLPVARGIAACRAALLESRGDLAGAQRRFARSLAPDDAYGRAVALALALACGEERAARRLASSLGRDPDERASAEGARAAAARVRARLAHWRRAGWCWSEGCAALAFQILCADGEAAARAVLALVG